MPASPPTKRRSTRTKKKVEKFVPPEKLRNQGTGSRRSLSTAKKSANIPIDPTRQNGRFVQLLTNESDLLSPK